MNPRKISNQELADLSNEWENPKVDTTKYYHNVIEAWEVSKDAYETYKKLGVLCQEHEGKYYIA
jgi:hypothetical protein